jgi:hypothetical protein
MLSTERRWAVTGSKLFPSLRVERLKANLQHPRNTYSKGVKGNLIPRSVIRMRLQTKRILARKL